VEDKETTVLCENTFTPTQAHYAQAYAAMTKFTDLLLFGFVILMALVLILSAIVSEQPFFSRDNLVPLIALGIAILAVVAQHFLLPKLYASRAVKRIRAAYGEIGALTVTVLSDGVRMYNATNDSEVRFSFDLFAHFSETRDLLLLRTFARQTVMASRTGFSEGFSEAQCKTLMQEKCPQAKIKWKK